MRYKMQYFMDFLWLLFVSTIPGAFLLLTSCASIPNKPEPFNVGECVEFAPRSVMGRVSKVYEQNGMLYYSIDLYKEELKDKPIIKVDCNKEGFSRPVRSNKT